MRNNQFEGDDEFAGSRWMDDTGSVGTDEVADYGFVSRFIMWQDFAFQIYLLFSGTSALLIFSLLPPDVVIAV